MPRKKELKAKSDGIDVATKIIIKKEKDIDKKMIKNKQLAVSWLDAYRWTTLQMEPQR